MLVTGRDVSELLLNCKQLRLIVSFHAASKCVHMHMLVTLMLMTHARPLVEDLDDRCRLLMLVAMGFARFVARCSYRICERLHQGLI